MIYSVSGSRNAQRMLEDAIPGHNDLPPRRCGVRSKTEKMDEQWNRFGIWELYGPYVFRGDTLCGLCVPRMEKNWPHGLLHIPNQLLFSTFRKDILPYFFGEGKIKN